MLRPRPDCRLGARAPGPAQITESNVSPGRPWDPIADSALAGDGESGMAGRHRMASSVVSWAAQASAHLWQTVVAGGGHGDPARLLGARSPRLVARWRVPVTHLRRSHLSSGDAWFRGGHRWVQPFTDCYHCTIACPCMSLLAVPAWAFIRAAIAGWWRSVARQRLRWAAMLWTGMPSLALISV